MNKKTAHYPVFILTPFTEQRKNLMQKFQKTRSQQPNLQNLMRSPRTLSHVENCQIRGFSGVNLAASMTVRCHANPPTEFVSSFFAGISTYNHPINATKEQLSRGSL